MIETIVDYLQTNGFSTSIENDRIVTTHLCENYIFSIIGDIDFINNRTLPSLYLKERYKFGALAHVSWDTKSSTDEGLICEGVSINRHIDFNNPHELYKKALESAVETVSKDLVDSEYNKFEIIKEFTAHWERSIQGNQPKVISFIEPGTMVEEIIAYQSSSLRLNTTFFVKGQANQINQEYAFLNNLMKKPQSRGKAIYLPVDFSILPPDPNTVIKDWWLEVIEKIDGKTQNHLKDFARRNYSQYLWVLGSVKLKENSYGWFCLFFKNKEKLILPLFKESDISTWEVIPYNINIHSKEYIIPRGGSTLFNKENTIAIVGCGSVGAEIARQIASSGINNLILIDPETLSIDNTYRHFLSPEHIGRKKSLELTLDLKRRYPYINATVTTENYLSDCLSNDFLSSIDGIIVATGSPTEERYFNEELLKLNNRPWVIYCWVEGYGVGGHAIYVHNTGKGCLNCLYRDGDGNKSLESIQNFLKAEQEIAVNLSGCGSHFLPYSFTDAIQTAIMATRLTLLALEKKLTESCRMSWKNQYTDENDLLTSYRYENFDNSLNIEPLYWEDCDVCNG